MEQNLFKSGLTQIAIFTLITLIIISITFWFIKKFIANKHKISDFNASYRITSAGLLVSVFYIMSGSTTPVFSVLNLIENNSLWNYAFEVSKYVSIFILIGMIFIFIIYFLSIKMISYYSKGTNIFDQIKNNNVGMSILIFVILFSFSLMLKDGIIMLMEYFIPYPETPNLLN